MGIGFSELILILVIILVVFGPGRLPEIGKALGGGIREFKDAQRSLPGDSSASARKENADDGTSNG